MKDQYWWFQGESVKELCDRLVVDPGAVRLEVRIDDEQRMTFRVVGGVQTRLHDDPDINDSHLCPPFCPG